MIGWSSPLPARNALQARLAWRAGRPPTDIINILFDDSSEHIPLLAPFAWISSAIRSPKFLEYNSPDL